MGVATTQALAAVKTALDGTTGVTLPIASELFQAAAVVGGSSQLSGALADWASAPEARVKVVSNVFGAALHPTAVSLLSAVVAERWVTPAELVDAIEDVAIRAASIAAGEIDLEGELFGIARAIAVNPELELALGSRVGDDAAKGDLVTRVFGERVSDATLAIVVPLVRQLRGRRVRPLLSRAERLVADQRGRTVATVVSAGPLTDAQSDRLRTVLSARYGESVTLNTVIDDEVVGGLRVQIADDVIDATVSNRLADLRQRLAG